MDSSYEKEILGNGDITIEVLLRLQFLVHASATIS